MTTPQKRIEKHVQHLINVQKEREEFERAHVAFMEQYNKTMERLAEAEAAVRSVLKDLEESLDIPELKTRFTFSSPKRVEVDYEKAFIRCKTQEQLERLRKISIEKIIVDVDAFQNLIREGNLPLEAQEAIKETILTPRITKTLYDDV